jgi:hypothetical protein
MTYIFLKNIIGIVDMLFISIIFEKNISDDTLSDIPYILAIVVVKKNRVYVFFIQKPIFDLKHLEKDINIFKKKIHKWP